MHTTPTVHIIGGGLAGSEAAWQALNLGAEVILHEMRPENLTPAHKTGHLAELVCSNSLKSLDLASASGCLKAEMQAFDSLVVRAALAAQVPAGGALAVDREIFSRHIEEALQAHPGFTRVAGEVRGIPSAQQLQAKQEVWIVATGPLTSEPLAQSLMSYCGGEKQLYFYDAIAPTLAADSIDRAFCFEADRYGKGSGDDYLNIPLNKEQYEAFVQDILDAEKVPLHSFEKVPYFESCLPIEVMAERGRETLRFGPLKPVGLQDPKTGKRPWAVIQLRKENVHGTMLSLVGFQTKMKWPEQKRVLSRLPGLADVEILRYGSIHRNTYVQSPKVLNTDLSLKNNREVFLAGQITGVEGYSESAAMGLIAGRMVAAKLGLQAFTPPPPTTVLGALLAYVTEENPRGKFAPMNANLGLLPPLTPEQKGSKKKLAKAEKKQLQCQAARESFALYFKQLEEKKGEG